MYPSQSNTQIGVVTVLAGEDLTGKEGHLVHLTHDTGVAEVQLPDTTDDAFGILVDGAADAAEVTVLPLDPARNARALLKSTCNPGDKLVLAAHAVAADKGKLRVLPATAGTYRVVGIAEEVGVDGQLLKFRPYGPLDITVTE